MKLELRNLNLAKSDCDKCVFNAVHSFEYLHIPYNDNQCVNADILKRHALGKFNCNSDTGLCLHYSNEYKEKLL